MGDLMRWAEERRARDPEFVDGLEAGYEEFRNAVPPRREGGRSRRTRGSTEARPHA